MAKEVTLQVKMDSELKEQAELLYHQLGTSFAEAVRIFAKQSVADKAMPFTMHLVQTKPKRKLGIANGKYEIPDDIDVIEGAPRHNDPFNKILLAQAKHEGLIFR